MFKYLNEREKKKREKEGRSAENTFPCTNAFVPKYMLAKNNRNQLFYD